MTHGSLNLRQYRRARRDGETLERACEISGLTHGEARLTDAEDARNPPPPEAFDLIGHNSRNETMSDSTVTADQQLRLFIERIERLEEERKGVADDIRDTYNEAKSQGYDTKIMRQIVRLRKMEPHDRAEMEQILETYKIALGMLAGTPLGDYALSRAA
jgi:uncharacterized protein (UPF0335 family)